MKSPGLKIRSPIPLTPRSAGTTAVGIKALSPLTKGAGQYEKSSADSSDGTDEESQASFERESGELSSR